MGRVSEACRRYGKHWGTIAVDPAYASRAFELGCRLLSFTSDVTSVRIGLETARKSFADFF
jgi:2-dehydro-3-deoxyglucarate aldolase/4-hydroxy-2-oxoheptanedioate aldolase